MISEDAYFHKKVYIKPEVIKVELDTSIVLMQVSNPNSHHHHTVGKGNEGSDNPFRSPFGDKPFS